MMKTSNYMSQFFQFVAMSLFMVLSSTINAQSAQDSAVYYIPNSFTPDGDELNSVFMPVFTGIYDPYQYELKVYDRKGFVIFESNDMRAGWDGTFSGKIVPIGTYTWDIKYRLMADTEDKFLIGHINVLR